MLFNSLQFALFMLLLLLLMLAVRRSAPRKLLLLVASYIFYMAWNPVFILLILASSLLDWYVGSAIGAEEEPRRRRALLLLSLIGNLGLLAFFKYSGFLSAGLLAFAKALGLDWDWEVWQPTLPVGISFYTFQTLSYTLDIYSRRLRPARSILDYALYVAFFPQLVAGPIVRAAEFLPQLRQRIALSLQPRAVQLIAGGLVKKVVIADNLAPYVNAVFADPSNCGSFDILLATLCFSTQIYCDFSGYSDMAIGLAAMFGLELPRNFNYPYFAQSPSGFWRRWHITLSRWLRDYLYIPLGGNRHGSLRTGLNLLLTMLLGGLWHGANWTFILWGAWHGLLLVLQRFNPLARHMPAGRASLPVRFGGWLLLQYCVLLGWVMFRAQDWETIRFMLQRLLLPEGGLSLYRFRDIDLFTVLGVLLLFWLFHSLQYFRQRGLKREPRWRDAWVSLAGATILLCLLWPADSPPFIYFQF